MPREDIEQIVTDLRVRLYKHTGGGTGVPTQILPHPNMHSSNVYTITNGTIDRTYDANASSTDELADVLYTLIQDLKTLGILS